MLKIEVQVDSHPTGNLTLKERQQGEAMWVDISEEGLFANDDPASFYKKVAQRLAAHSQKGVQIISYTDTTPAKK